MEQALSAVASVESQVPFVYTQKCKQLCDELTANRLPSPSFTEAFRRLSDQLLSPERAAAFIFQCLRGLGWREDLGELQRVADTGFSLQVTYLDIWRRLSEIKRDIEVARLREIGLEISSQLSGFLMFILRVALVGSLIPDPIQGNHSSFLDLFNHLLDTLKDPSLAASIVTSVLKRFDYSSESTRKLEQYAIPGFNLHRRYPEISLRLRVVEFFYTLGEQDCLLAMMILSYRHLQNHTIYDIAPLEFVLNLFNRGENSVIKISDVSKIQKLAALFQQPNFFNGYCNLSTVAEGSFSKGTTSGTEQEATPATDTNITLPLLEGGECAATDDEGDATTCTCMHSDTCTGSCTCTIRTHVPLLACAIIGYDASDDAVKCRMKFMIEPQHPDSCDDKRLAEFFRTGSIPVLTQTPKVVWKSSLKYCVPSSKLCRRVCVFLLILVVVIVSLCWSSHSYADTPTDSSFSDYLALVEEEYSYLRHGSKPAVA